MTSGFTATVRAMHSRCCWPPDRLRPLAASLSLTSSHSAARRSAVLDPGVELGARQALVEPDAEGDVLVDRHRERRRLLEHHADARAQQVDVLVGAQQVVAVEQHLAGGALAGIEVVHAVQHAQQRRLAAARRADEGRRLVGVERQADALERPAVAVEEIEIADRDLLGAGPRCRCLAWVGHGNGDAGRVRGWHAHDDFLAAVRERAMMLSASTVTVISSAPVQASFCHSS